MFRRKDNFEKQARQSEHLLKKLFSLRIVKMALILLLLAISVPFIIFLYLKPQPAKNINYGVTFSNKYSTEIGQNWKDTFLKISDELNVKNMRLVVYWDDVEKIRNRYDYSDIEWQLNEADKKDINVMLTIGKKVPRYPECFSPDWWKDIKNKTEKDNELLEYITKTVNTLKNHQSIKMWQVENEPFWPFGICEKTDKPLILNEIKIVRSLDNRPVIMQDSGEGGLWRNTFNMTDYLGISMYRKFWYDFFYDVFGKETYFKYPLSYWSYKIKADIVGIPLDKIIITELQAEPWGPRINSKLTHEERDKTMSRNDFIDTLSYAQKSGFKDIYFWGAEWWLWEKDVDNNSFYWDTAKPLFR